MKTYYCYMKNCMERVDSCTAFSRIGAAKHFANKKNIDIKSWLNIYTVLEQYDFNNYYNKTITFISKFHTIVYLCNKDQKFISKIDNDIYSHTANKIPYYKLKSFISYMKKCGWIIETSDIEDTKRTEYHI